MTATRATVTSLQGTAIQRALSRSSTPARTWRDVARAEQVAPAGDWSTWLYMAGRGSGKTRAGAEWVHEQIAAGCRRIALVGATAADVRDVMGAGESGILATARPGARPDYEPSRRRLTWPAIEADTRAVAREAGLGAEDEDAAVEFVRVHLAL